MTFFRKWKACTFLFLSLYACSSVTPVTIQHRSLSRFEPIFHGQYESFCDFYDPVSYFEISESSDFVSFDVTIFEWKDASWQRSIIHTFTFDDKEEADLIFGKGYSDCALYLQVYSNDSYSSKVDLPYDLSGLEISSISQIQLDQSDFVPIMAFYEKDHSFSLDDFQKDLGDFSGRYYFLCLSLSQV